jgi:Skp family chaperone for outer membrane proteins
VDRVIVLDLARVLDDSPPGRAARATLEAAWANEPVKDDAARARIAARRDQARDALLARVRPIVEALCVERGASVVIDRAAVIASGAGVDVTDDVIARLGA